MAANRISLAEWRKLAGKPRKAAKAKPAAKRPRKPTPFVAPAYGIVDGGIEVTVPLRLKSLNKQENGFARHRRVKMEHEAIVRLLNRAMRVYGLIGHQLVTLTRLGPVLLDDDNNFGALKASTDATARWLGVSDAPDSPTKFVRKQEKSPAFGVKIRIEPLKKEASNG